MDYFNVYTHKAINGYLIRLRVLNITMKYFWLLAILFNGAWKTNAGTLEGIVTDSHGVTLPFATIYAEGTTIGTTANANGVYILNLNAGTYNIVCQFIGYKQEHFTITIGATDFTRHDFKLAEQTFEMKEAVVHGGGEDPAYRIIREAIKKRVFHLRQVQSFQTDIYLKGVMRMRTMVDQKFMGKPVFDSTQKKNLVKVWVGILLIM